LLYALMGAQQSQEAVIMTDPGQAADRQAPGSPTGGPAEAQAGETPAAADVAGLAGQGPGGQDGASGPAVPENGEERAPDAGAWEPADIAAQRDQYLALAQRTQADFENYRKRVAKESVLALDKGVTKLAKELLPAIDNLDRALDGAATDDPLLEGVRLVRAELSAALARVGVESFSPDGEAFDPVVHEAMSTVAQPPEGGTPSGTVVEVYQPGYKLGEQVIRPARVVVAA
jgi:molecular chaperone GrpE